MRLQFLFHDTQPEFKINFYYSKLLINNKQQTYWRFVIYLNILNLTSVSKFEYYGTRWNNYQL